MHVAVHLANHLGMQDSIGRIGVKKNLDLLAPITNEVSDCVALQRKRCLQVLDHAM